MPSRRAAEPVEDDDDFSDLVCTSTTAASPRTPVIASGSSATMIAIDNTTFWLMMLRPGGRGRGPVG